MAFRSESSDRCVSIFRSESVFRCVIMRGFYSWRKRCNTWKIIFRSCLRSPSDSMESVVTPMVETFLFALWAALFFVSMSSCIPTMWDQALLPSHWTEWCLFWCWFHYCSPSHLSSQLLYRSDFLLGNHPSHCKIWGTLKQNNRREKGEVFLWSIFQSIEKMGILFQLVYLAVSEKKGYEDVRTCWI